MRKKFFDHNRIFTRVGAAFLAMSMCLWLLPVGLLTVHAESGVYITEIALMQGELSTLSLEESGYSVIEQPLNLVGTSGLYLGYRTGGKSSAIRDLMVSAKGSDSIVVEGHTYQKVSNISLNSEAGGSKLYLYASRDAEAGEPLRGISFFAKQTPEGLEEDASLLASDGSEVVITDEGKVADFDQGIGNSELYLRMYKGNLYRPYVENVIVATDSSEEGALAKLAAKRCTYYVNYDIGDGKPVFVGYTRTDDENKALRSLVAIGESEVGELEIMGIPYTQVEGGVVKAEKDYTLYMTKDKKAGEPVIDLVACGYDPTEMGLLEVKNKETMQTSSSETSVEPGYEEDIDGLEDTFEDEEDIDGLEDAFEEEEDIDGLEDDFEEEEDIDGTEDAFEGEEDIVGLEDDVEDEEEIYIDESKLSDASDSTKEITDEISQDVSSGDDGKTEKETEEADNQSASGYRVYTEIARKDWISGYFLRGGGQTAAKYLYEESDFTAASNSNEKLWISNIFCKDKDGKQFTNCIGCVTKPIGPEADLFATSVAYDDVEQLKAQMKKEAGSTASVFG
ncbi:MAG: hypothetical protein K6G65_00530, partial [Lachnospiraceae bacterium]|nr:hypothetical protein [Lachnospiraceae bacterium]